MYWKIEPTQEDDFGFYAMPAVTEQHLMYPNHYESKVRNDAMREAIKAINKAFGVDDD